MRIKNKIAKFDKNSIGSYPVGQNLNNTSIIFINFNKRIRILSRFFFSIIDVVQGTDHCSLTHFRQLFPRLPTSSYTESR